MADELGTEELRKPRPIPPVAPGQTQTGTPIAPMDRLRVMSAGEWEDVILEWADSLKDRYAKVVRSAGAGDQGRDVIAYLTDDVRGPWDNFQCKHYDHPLQPSDVWLEMAKFLYFTFVRAYSVPRRYYLVAPHGVGTTLVKLLEQPEELKRRLVQEWEERKTFRIGKSQDIALEGDFREHVERLDFSIFDHEPPLKIVEQHRKTPAHVARFGGGLPPRPSVQPPPPTVAAEETNYVRCLLDAYGDHLKHVFASAEQLDIDEFRAHFARCRQHFYSAESLRVFSRDTLPEGEYRRLQDEFYDGLVDIVYAKHDDGYKRLAATLAEARKLQVTDHALVQCMSLGDRCGICHQLANDQRVTWVAVKKQ